jgi:hypothetical protein
MTTSQLSDSLRTLSPDVLWDIRLMCVCGAIACLFIAIDLTMKAVRAFAQALTAAAMGALAAGAAIGLLAAVTLSTL